MGDIGEVWNIVTDTATLFQNGQSKDMGQRAFACPKGVNPGDLDWSHGGQETLSYAKTWTNRAREWFGLSSGTQLRIGCTWSYGGSSEEHPGLYLHDAYLWAVLDYSSAGTNYEVKGGFGDAAPYGNSAELSAWITITMKFMGMHWEDHRFDIRIRGNGYGVLRPV